MIIKILKLLDLNLKMLSTDTQQNNQELQNSFTLEVQLPPDLKLALLKFQEQRD